MAHLSGSEYKWIYDVNKLISLADDNTTMPLLDAFKTRNNSHARKNF